MFPNYVDRSHSTTCLVLYFGLSDKFQSIFADFADVLGSHFDTLDYPGRRVGVFVK